LIQVDRVNRAEVDRELRVLEADGHEDAPVGGIARFAANPA
jgi:hypothetical protein